MKQAFSEIHEKDMTTASHLAQIRDFEEKLALNESRVQEQKNQLANLSMKFDEQFSEQNHRELQTRKKTKLTFVCCCRYSTPGN